MELMGPIGFRQSFNLTRGRNTVPTEEIITQLSYGYRAIGEIIKTLPMIYAWSDIQLVWRKHEKTDNFAGPCTAVIRRCSAIG
jgi:hypothetical protein